MFLVSGSAGHPDVTAGSLSLAEHAPDPASTRELDGVRLLGLPAGLVAGTAGRTLLWARRPLGEEDLEALRGAALDAAVLDLAGRDPIELAHDLARLRRVGAMAARADLLAVGTSGAWPPRRVAARLGLWGVRLVTGGVTVGADSGVDHDPSPGLPRRTLVLGPASSGKSAHAEDLLAAEPEVTYVATAPPPEDGDAEWSARIARHRGRRPRWWTTTETTLAGSGAVEADQDLLPLLLVTPGPPLLVDSLGGWAAARLTRCGAWEDRPGWSDRWLRDVETLADAWRSARRPVVAVGEETGWGIVPATPAGRTFRDALGSLTQRLARDSDRTLLVVAGRAVDLDLLDRLGALDVLDELERPGGLHGTPGRRHETGGPSR